MGDTSSSKQHKTVPLQNQVAGHPDGVQSLEGGRLVVKVCLPRELEFYQQVRQAAAGRVDLDARQVELLQRLLRKMPECGGSWEEHTGAPGETSKVAGRKGDDQAPWVVMENLTFGYDKPNVCDIKLGTQLWDEDASQEKRQRMDEAAANTTSGSHGIRLTGWQTYDAETSTYHSIPKTFGKTIKPQHLELGMRMILACPEQGDADQAEEVLAGSSIHDGASAHRLASLPYELIEQVLQEYLIKDLEELHAIFSEVEVRMRGASLLIVYEGEPARLGQILDQGGSEAERGKPQVRLIDFGHATIVRGQGPDQGVLLGLTSVLELAKKTLANLKNRRGRQQQQQQQHVE